jgi:hypothetical protein
LINLLYYQLHYNQETKQHKTSFLFRVLRWFALVNMGLKTNTTQHNANTKQTTAATATVAL